MNQEILALEKMGRNEMKKIKFSQRIVMRSGIKYGKDYYFHAALLPYEGTKVLVLKGKKGLQVFDAHGSPICTAEEVIFSSAKPAKEKNGSSD
jgi:hypothetical protein